MEPLGSQRATKVQDVARKDRMRFRKEMGVCRLAECLREAKADTLGKKSLKVIEDFRTTRNSNW